MAKFVNWIQMIVIKEGVRDESKKMDGRDCICNVYFGHFYTRSIRRNVETGNERGFIRMLNDTFTPVVICIGLNPENIPQSEEGELKGTPARSGNRYRIAGCEQSSDGTFLYMKLKYEKTDVVTNKRLRTGTF